MAEENKAQAQQVPADEEEEELDDW